LWEAEISVCRRFLAALTLANCLIYALSITVTEQNCSLGGGKPTLWVVAVQNATTRDDDKNKRYSKLHSGARVFLNSFSFDRSEKNHSHRFSIFGVFTQPGSFTSFAVRATRRWLQPGCRDY
jgi:hypothetical protein